MSNVCWVASPFTGWIRLAVHESIEMGNFAETRCAIAYRLMSVLLRVEFRVLTFSSKYDSDQIVDYFTNNHKSTSQFFFFCSSPNCPPKPFSSNEFIVVVFAFFANVITSNCHRDLCLCQHFSVFPPYIVSNF